MITEKFSDLFDFAKKSKIKAGDGLKEGLYPFYTSSAKLSKRIDIFQEDKISLIFGTGGKASVHYADEQFSTSTDCIVAFKKENKELNEKFVYYYLFGNIHVLERGFKGAGLKHISKKYIQNLDIPILPIEIQNKIVDLLNKASKLVQKREKNIALLDELLRMQFLEMFGDPMFNPKKYKCSTLKDVCHFITKGTTPKAKEIHTKSFEGSVPFLKVYNITDNGTIDFSYKPSYISKEIHSNFLKRSKVYPNDVLMNIVGPPLGKIGIVNSSFEEWNVNQAIAIFRCTNLISPIYLLNVLRSENILNKIIRKAVGVRQLNISLEICRNIKIPIPPIELQNQFETIHHNIQTQKETLTQSKTELEHLYNSLLQESFKGEIEVSKKEVKKKDSLMSEIKKKDGEKVDITNLDLATFLGIPDEITSTQEKWMFDLISLDEFYQFLLKDNFTKEEAFTLQDIEEKLHHFFYHGGDMDFPNANWQQIIFKFIEAKPPLLEQIFDKETATVKLKLTDETFKA